MVWSDSKTGYTCAFQVYTGKVGDTTEKNFGARLVKDLTKDIKGKNYFAFFDFWLTLWVPKFIAQQLYYLLGKNFQNLVSPESKHCKGEST